MNPLLILVGKILLMKPIHDIDEAFSLLLQEETQRTVGAQPTGVPEITCASCASDQLQRPDSNEGSTIVLPLQHSWTHQG